MSWSVCNKMRVEIYSCLVALVLGCSVTAEIIRKVIEKKESFTLPCPHPEGWTVTWSRENNGQKVPILSVIGDRDERHICFPYKRYSSLADKSLYIFKADPSDSGRYYCNDELAAEVLVIPIGTSRLTVKERSNVTLMCPPGVGRPDVSTWSRGFGSKSITVSQSEEGEESRFQASANGSMLTITDVQLDDSGLYSCDGEPAVYLTVIE
ncbi:uncharacterized protein [Trachinotus anak]|uniref:uncharacterized protein n=1 Tax=Trachinotus anak TaxID=443729 RepID=UPI0039F1AF88